MTTLAGVSATSHITAHAIKIIYYPLLVVKYFFKIIFAKIKILYIIFLKTHFSFIAYIFILFLLLIILTLLSKKLIISHEKNQLFSTADFVLFLLFLSFFVFLSNLFVPRETKGKISS